MVRPLLRPFAVLASLLAAISATTVFVLPLAGALASDVTPVPIPGSCQGVLPNGASGNTEKVLIGGNLQPGGTATFEISYPLDASSVGQTFTVEDCPVIGGDVAGAQKYEFTVVPNSQVFLATFTLTIPAGTPLGTTYCNYAKTTGSPSAAQADNRKAGPACFTVGGNLVLNKRAAGDTTDYLQGANFTVTCPDLDPYASPPTGPQVDVTGLFTSPTSGLSSTPGSTSGLTAATPSVTSGSSATGYTYTYTITGYADTGSIGISGPSGDTCTVTENAAPPGYAIVSPATSTYQIPVGSSQVSYNIIDNPVVPKLGLTKTASVNGGAAATGTSTNPITVAPGDTITYTLSYYNTGTAPATDVTITDPVPTGLTFAGTSTCSSTCTYSNGTVTFTSVGTVNDGTSASSPAGSVSFGAIVEQACTTSVTTNCVNNGDVLINSAYATASNETGKVYSNPTYHEVKFPILSQLKSVTPSGVVTTGTVLTYLISVQNTGLAPADNVSITDAVPTNTTYVASSAVIYPDCGSTSSGTGTLSSGTVSWTVDVPAASGGTAGTVCVGFQVTVNPGTANGTVISNTAVVNGTPTNTVTNTVGVPVISVVKTSAPTSGTQSAPAPVAPGSTITYTIKVSNTSSLVGTTVDVSDPLPAGTTFAGVGTCSQTCTYTGGAVVFTAVSVPAAGSTTLSFQVTVNPAGTAPGDTSDGEVLVNTAQVTYCTAGTLPACSGGSAVTTDSNSTYHQVVFAVLTQTKSETSPGAGQPVAPGQKISYAITVANTGLAAASNVSVCDPVPAGTSYDGDANLSGALSTGTCPPVTTTTGEIVTWTIASIPAGGSVTVTFSVTVAATVTNGETIANTAAVNGTATNTVTNPVAFAVLGAPVKSASPTGGSSPTGAPTVAPGSTITYTIAESNSGDAAATVTVTDTPPAGTTFAGISTCSATCSYTGGVVTFSSVVVPANSTTSVSFQVAVNPAGTATGDTTNGEVLANTGAVNAVSTNTVYHQVAFPALVGVKAEASPGAGQTVTPGQDISYQLTVYNCGLAAASGVTLTDPLPADTSFVSASSPGSDSAGTVTWSGLSVPAGTDSGSATAPSGNLCTTPLANGDYVMPGSIAETLMVVVASTAINGETIANTAAVNGTATNTVTNTVSIPVKVLGITITRQAPTQVLGETFTKGVLPFTGLGFRPGPAALVGLLMIALGVAFNVRRKPRRSRD